MITKDPLRAVTLARALDTSPEILGELTLFPLRFVREAAISNAATPLSAITQVAPSALNTEADVRIARAIASRSDAPTPVLEQLVGLLRPSNVDGARRENWPYEQLAVVLLSHPNLPVHAREEFFQNCKVSKRLRSEVLSAVAGPANE